MKLVKKFVLPALFVSALTVNAFAGELETPGFVPPPPPENSVTYSAPSNETEVTYDELTASTEASSDELIYEAYMALLTLF